MRLPRFLKIIFDFFIDNYWLFFLVGIACLLIGVNKNTLDEFKELFLVFGDSLIVFVLVNGIIEEKFKKRLSDQINNDIVYAFLVERTSSEIAESITKNSYFKSDMLKTKTETTYKFFHDSSNEDIIHFSQLDVFDIKNVSKDIQVYDMSLKLTSTDTKPYVFTKAGYYDIQSQYTNLPIDDSYFEIIIATDEPAISYKLRSQYQISIKPGESIKVIRKLKADFATTDDIEDYFFANQYMNDLTLKIKSSEKLSFNLYPTYLHQEKLEVNPDFSCNVMYKMPFLFPGQGYSYVLKKIN